LGAWGEEEEQACQSLLKVRPKSPKGKLIIEPKKQPRIKSHRPSKVNDIWNLSAAYKNGDLWE